RPLAFPLADYLRSVLPAPSGEGAVPASCLRLAPREEAGLPGDVRATLRDMRQQVISYIEELRRLGLAEGCEEATLWWAFDMVISRAFAVTATLPPATSSSSSSSPSSSPSPAAVPLALYLPWACLLNHSSTPNAVFTAVLSPPTPAPVLQAAPQRATPPTAPVPASALTPKPPRALSEFQVTPRLRYASPPIQPGAEICISYGDGLDNVRLLLKYGFCTAGNPNDRLPLPPGAAAVAARLDRRVLCSAAEKLAERRMHGPAGMPGAACEEEKETTQPQGTTAAAGKIGSQVEREQHRARVYAALATLLEATDTSPPGNTHHCGSTSRGAATVSTLGSPTQLFAWARASAILHAKE
ncbi:hypothetical protein Agub_g11155, partial [Astrephomene gubernaculifera]